MQEKLFTLGRLDQTVPADHPLRRVRDVFNGCLVRMDTHFGRLFSPFGRESVPAEKLLRALMLQVLFGVRSERQQVRQKHRENAASTSIQAQNQASLVVNQSQSCKKKLELTKT